MTKITPKPKTMTKIPQKPNKMTEIPPKPNNYQNTPYPKKLPKYSINLKNDRNTSKT